MKIVFMGTPDFAVPSLHALTEAGYAVAAVVTQPDKPKGRGKTFLLTVKFLRQRFCRSLRKLLLQPYGLLSQCVPDVR